MKQILFKEICKEKPNSQALGSFNDAVEKTANSFISYAKENNSINTLKVLSRGISGPSKFGEKSKNIGNAVSKRINSYLKNQK
jgi:hypothetical protein